MKELVLGLIEDLVKDFTYYERKECEQLTQEQLYEVVKNKEVTIDEMVEQFRKSLEKAFND